jgi:NAD+ kinase
MCIIGSYSVLNEAVVDRGQSPFLSVLDLTCNSHHLTTVQGDGIIFATPTGSTAYSLSAGGSIVYPSVPAILLTPICAHSLSFRPMLLPDSAVLHLEVPLECRSSAWVSFDGKHRQRLLKGDRLRIRMSPYPLPTMNRYVLTSNIIIILCH